MFNKFRSVIYNVVGGIEPLPVLKDSESSAEGSSLSPKFPYTRPHFLQFHSDEEIQWSADHHIRPIIVPRDISKIPWNSGYAEAVNAGKSQWNEDQACIQRGFLQRPEGRGRCVTPSAIQDITSLIPNHLNAATCLPYVYFAMFDGHAGAGAAVAAANQLHHILQEKLIDVIDHLLPPLDGVPEHLMEGSSRRGAAMWFPGKDVSQEALIIGALESSFWDMDQLIAEDRQKYAMKGGCTALVALFILGKVYVANAGDSRAVLCRYSAGIPLSNDFTPETERQRIRRLAALQPELLGGEFTHLDYCRKPCEKDLGKRILYRDAHMTGWAYKTVTRDDLKFPVVYGEGKRSRVLATIGVTRGFGDHDLKALYCNVPIKPFLLSQPEVQVLDLQTNFTNNDVLVMGTDGLWDVTSNEKAAEIVQKSLTHFPANEDSRLKYRYTSAAQDLVMHSRGKLHERNWRTADGKPATIDDISVFVIPLIPYKDEHLLWKRHHDAIHGIYDNTPENTTLGQLALRTSPAPERKHHPVSERKHYTFSENRVNPPAPERKFIPAATEREVSPSFEGTPSTSAPERKLSLSLDRKPSDLAPKRKLDALEKEIALPVAPIQYCSSSSTATGQSENKDVCDSEQSINELNSGKGLPSGSHDIIENGIESPERQELNSSSVKHSESIMYADQNEDASVAVAVEEASVAADEESLPSNTDGYL